MFDEVFGLPTHALIVHAVVVLLPMAALGGVAVALVPSLRSRYGTLVGLLTVAAVASVPVATNSGEELFRRQSARFGAADATEAGLMEEHRELGEQLLPWALVLLVGVALVLLPPLLARRAGVPTGTPVPAGAAARPGRYGSAHRSGSAPSTGPGPDEPARPGWVRPVAVLAAVVTLVGATLTLVLVLRAGHAGSKATWERLNQPAAIAFR